MILDIDDQGRHPNPSIDIGIGIGVHGIVRSQVFLCRCIQLNNLKNKCKV